jgi:phosphoserine aminotransferase
MANRIYNFSAGPATLPLAALEEAGAHLMSLPGLGMSVLEISHRSKAFTEIIEEAEANIRTLLALPDSHHVLFLQGGASLQFSMVPMNFLTGEKKDADYILTGSWGNKAVKEAKKEGTVRFAWDGKESNYVRTPKDSELKIDPNASYVHFTSNETIEGVQFAGEPETGGIPLVCDMSSDFLSRPIQTEDYGLIYAGAQKNAGPAGVTLVLVREDMLERIPDGLPSMLDYRTYAKERSLYNTPPVFSIYMAMLVTRWLLNEIGGLGKMAELNASKAALLYDVIDKSDGYFRGHAKKESRSKMNVTWRLPSEELEKTFVSEAKENSLDGLKGHRSVGGIRASIYNAFPMEGVDALISFMEAFEAKNG